jgi:predicted CopG family antitoxin
MTRIISISDNAYDELKRLKNGMSFTEIILELSKMKKKESIMRFAGALKNKEWESIKKELIEERKLKSRRFK